MRSRILVFLIVVALMICVRPAIATNPKVINLNNQGVHALNGDDFDSAIAIFKDALNLDPGYTLAKLNLAITYNNAGLKYRRSSPARSLKYFHEAILVNPFNKITRSNLDELLIRLGRDPDSFYDRATLGAQFEAEGDIKSAIVEYWFALKNKKDEELTRKVIALSQSIRKDEPYLVDLSFTPIEYDEHPSRLPGGVPKIRDVEDEFSPYMCDLQRRIKEHWAPPRIETSYRVTVQFKINRSGKVTHLGMFSTSGSLESDAAALRAVDKSAPLPPPPLTSRDTDVDIQFTFDYNVFSQQHTVEEIEVIKSWRGFPSSDLPIIRM